MMKKPERSIFLLLVVLILASLACNLPGRGSQPTIDVIPVPTEGLQFPQINNQNSGQVSFTVDEAELTSLIASELQKQQDPLLQDPKVLLRDGQLKLTGKVQQAGITADLVMVMTISATQDGHLAFQIVSAQLGPFPLPQDLKDSLSKQLNSAFMSDIDPRIENLFVESITITDGQMTIQGHPR